MKRLKRLLGYFFLIESLLAICIFIFTDTFQKEPIVGMMTFFLFALLSYFCLKKAKPRIEKIEPKNTASLDKHSDISVKTNTDIPSSTQYVETENTIYRTDGKSITDEEVPYLMQVGYEETLDKEELYKGQVLDLSFMQARDKNKKEYTRIPTYQELSEIKPNKTYVSQAEILFLNYINGLPLQNPLIAQKWFYDYNLHYSKTIIKLISNGLLTVEHACIDRLKNDELKNILKKFNYSTNGKKNELLERIHSNISQSDIDDYFNHAKYFSITPKGKEIIKGL